VAAARHGILTANVVTTVTITDAWPGGIDIVNRSLTGEIWVTLDGSTPTVAGDDCYVVLGARRFDNPSIGDDTVAVRLLSTAALAYSVESTVPWA
jgi:hypothetical protein